jgi:hypothetical protein
MSHFGRRARSAALVSMALIAPACSNHTAEQNAEAPETSAPSPEAPEVSAASEPGLPTSEAPASDAPAIQTLFVRDQRATCEAEGARECLMVRASEAEAWRLFYASIQGFEYEPTYTYELRVVVSPVANPPADAPSLRYELVEVVSKKKVGM